MELFGTNFGYDEYNPINYYSVQPEDLNPALRLGHFKKVNDYYSEPPVSRQKTRKLRGKCTCKQNSLLRLLIIILIVITVVQWVMIFSNNNSVIINNITSKDSEN